MIMVQSNRNVKVMIHTGKELQDWDLDQLWEDYIHQEE